VGWILTGQFGSDRPNADDPAAAPSGKRHRKMKVRVAEISAIAHTENVNVTGRTEASRKVEFAC